MYCLSANVEFAQVSISSQLTSARFQDLLLGLLTKELVYLFYFLLFFWQKRLAVVEFRKIGGSVGVGNSVDVFPKFSLQNFALSHLQSSHYSGAINKHSVSRRQQQKPGIERPFLPKSPHLRLVPSCHLCNFSENNVGLGQAAALGVDQHCDFIFIFRYFLEHGVHVESANLIAEYVQAEMVPWMRMVGTACCRKLSDEGNSLDSLASVDIYIRFIIESQHSHIRYHHTNRQYFINARA